MLEEIRKAIDIQLSSEVGSVLKKRLEQADKADSQVVELQSRLAGVSAEVVERQSEIDRLNKQIKDQASLAIREKTCRELEVELARKSAVLDTLSDSLANRNDDIFRLVETLFKNSTIRRDTMHSAVVGNFTQEYDGSAYRSQRTGECVVQTPVTEQETQE